MDSLSTSTKTKMTITDETGKVETGWIKKLTDHAWFNKSDVLYDKSAAELVIRLKRYPKNTKARKKILGFVIWRNSIHPTCECLLTIKDVEKCDIKDGDPGNPKRETVTSGGLIIDGKQIYIGSFCEHENPYGIKLKVKQVNVTLEDT